MNPPESPIETLAEHAHETRVVVVGGGIAGLVAALECAKVGMRVTLLEKRDALGGAIRSAEVDGVEIPVGADGYATVGGHVGELVDELGLRDLVRPETGVAAWVSGVPGGPAPLPTETVLGIPVNPWDPAVRRIIGWRGVWRAYLDRLRPPLTIGQQTNLDKLVRGRMGDLVVDRLVAPLSVGRHGLLPSDVDVEVAAPGLGTALTRTGSLGGAVAQVREAATARPRYETLDGGLVPLVDALAARLSTLGADVRSSAGVDALERAGSRAWRVVLGEELIDADVVIVATAEDDARRLLGARIDAAVEDDEDRRALEVVTLVVDGAVPARTVYPVPGSSPALAVLAQSARWPWLADRIGAGRSVVRVTLASTSADDDLAIAEAAGAASTLLGGAPLSVRDGRVDRFENAPVRSKQGRTAAAERVRAAVGAVRGLAVVGAWVSGSGLAQVIPDATAEAERVRRAALFAH